MQQIEQNNLNEMSSTMSLLVAQSFLLDTIAQDNIELISALNMFIDNPQVRNFAGEEICRTVENLLSKVFKDREQLEQVKIGFEIETTKQ